ncbi:hypothetical protein [Thiohalocapsa marina]|uniref:hypothetical protein n=1 Tax=Thiohalocapsa marina TaxID=424902 RepID=UPI0036D7A3D6
MGKKDGSYFVRGPFMEAQPQRADVHITEAELLILDGDSTLDPETGDITPGAPAPLLVHEALTGLDIPHLIYTSWSHRQPGKGNRYRVLIPAPIPDPATLSACIEWTLEQLQQAGLCVADVTENHTWSQAWYMPRKAAPNAEYLTYYHDTCEPFNVAACVAWKAAQDPLTPPALEALALATKPRDNSGLFSQYNQRHGTPEAMLALLQGEGYKLKGEGAKINGAPSWRLEAPGSTSGAAGVVLFQARDGRLLVASHHGEHDRLNEGRTTGDKLRAQDAFDLFRIFQHGGDQSKALAAWRAELDPRPVIRISGGALQRNLAKAAAALAALDPPEVYQRGQTLCRVAHLPETGIIQGCIVPKGTATLVTLQRAGLGVELAGAAKWERKAKDRPEWYESDPCPKVTGALLEAAGKWGDIPTLLGISEAPVLRADGTLHSEAGYDPATRLYIEGRSPAIALGDNIGLATAQQAAGYLLHPFREFPFVRSELDHAALLAYLFTLALRPQLSTAPLFCVSATTPGTGKGLLVEACNLLVRGRDAALMPAIQGTGAEEETRKRITSLLLQGVASINLDNWTKPIGGESMNALLTASEWSDRVLGRSESVTLPARITLAATGNNLSVRGDMTRRSLLIQLDANCERPERRDFQTKDLPGYVLQHRAPLLGALFTILKAYQQAGRPGATEHALGRFEPWSAAVAAPIRWLGYPCPTETQERLREQDPEAEKLAILLEAWDALKPAAWITAAELMAEADWHDDFNQGTQTKRRALLEALLEVAGDGRGNINQRALGWCLRHLEGRIANGLRFVKKPRRGSQKHVQQYRVEHVLSDPATGTDAAW